LLCFMPGETKKLLEEALATCERRREKRDWGELFESVLLSEERYGMSKKELAFSNMTVKNVFSFNVDTRMGYVPDLLVSTNLGITSSKKSLDKEGDTSKPPG
jgi:hypothetical protein